MRGILVFLFQMEPPPDFPLLPPPSLPLDVGGKDETVTIESPWSPTVNNGANGRVHAEVATGSCASTKGDDDGVADVDGAYIPYRSWQRYQQKKLFKMNARRGKFLLFNIIYYIIFTLFFFLTILLYFII